MNEKEKNDKKKNDDDKNLNEKKEEEKTTDIYLIGKEKKITIFKLAFNSFLSLLLIFFVLYIPHTYEKKWKIFFFMTLWSFSMNSYYIVSITVIDWVCFLKKNHNCCHCYNNFVRNKYLRICFPFAIAIVFLYWLLILLGDDFEYRGREITDTAVGVFFHGIILIFLLFDMFTSLHINKINYLYDLLILTLLIGAYFILLGIGKYALEYDPYDFMEMSDVRQIIGACILIFIAIMDGYVVFNLIAKRFFEPDVKKKKKIHKNIDDKNENKIYDEDKPLKYINSESRNDYNTKIIKCKSVNLHDKKLNMETIKDNKTQFEKRKSYKNKILKKST